MRIMTTNDIFHRNVLRLLKEAARLFGLMKKTPLLSAESGAIKSAAF